MSRTLEAALSGTLTDTLNKLATAEAQRNRLAQRDRLARAAEDAIAMLRKQRHVDSPSEWNIVRWEVVRLLEAARDGTTI